MVVSKIIVTFEYKLKRKNMKKLLVISALVIAFGTSCKKEEIVKPCKDQKIDQSTLKDKIVLGK